MLGKHFRKMFLQEDFVVIGQCSTNQFNFIWQASGSMPWVARFWLAWPPLFALFCCLSYLVSYLNVITCSFLALENMSTYAYSQLTKVGFEFLQHMGSHQKLLLILQHCLGSVSCSSVHSCLTRSCGNNLLLIALCIRLVGDFIFFSDLIYVYSSSFTFYFFYWYLF